MRGQGKYSKPGIHWRQYQTLGAKDFSRRHGDIHPPKELCIFFCKRLFESEEKAGWVERIFFMHGVSTAFVHRHGALIVKPCWDCDKGRRWGFAEEHKGCVKTVVLVLANITVIIHLYIIMYMYIYIYIYMSLSLYIYLHMIYDITNMSVRYIQHQKTNCTLFSHFNDYAWMKRRDLTVH